MLCQTFMYQIETGPGALDRLIAPRPDAARGQAPSTSQGTFTAGNGLVGLGTK
jgi:hypothetical protein